MGKRAVYHAHLESINTLKEKKHVQIVKLDVQPISQATIKVNVCYVPLDNRLHELAVLNVKIVVLAGSVVIARNAKLANTAPLHRTILRHVLHAVLEDINPMLVKQFVFRVRLESINTLKER